MVQVSEVFGDLRDKIQEYFCKILDKNGKVSISKHGTYFMKNDPTAIKVEEISRKYRLSFAVIKYLLDHQEITEFHDTCVICGEPLIHDLELRDHCKKRSCVKHFTVPAYKKTCLDKYGVEFPMQNATVREKHRNTRKKNRTSTNR